MKLIFSYKDIVDLLLADNNILYLHWKDLNITLEEKIIIHERMNNFIVYNKINKIISDFSTARGALSPEIIEYSNNTAYPTLDSLGIKKFAIIIPINEKALKSYIDYSNNSYNDLEFMNFLLPSEAIAWLDE